VELPATPVPETRDSAANYDQRMTEESSETYGEVDNVVTLESEPVYDLFRPGSPVAADATPANELPPIPGAYTPFDLEYGLADGLFEGAPPARGLGLPPVDEALEAYSPTTSGSELPFVSALSSPVPEPMSELSTILPPEAHAVEYQWDDAPPDSAPLPEPLGELPVTSENHGQFALEYEPAVIHSSSPCRTHCPQHPKATVPSLLNMSGLNIHTRKPHQLLL